MQHIDRIILQHKLNIPLSLWKFVDEFFFRTDLCLIHKNDHQILSFLNPDHLQLVEDLRRGGKKMKADKRMTGSSIIDEVLQEVNIVF